MSSVTGNFHPGNRLLIFFCYLTEKEDEVICGGFVGFFTKFFSKKIIDCILFFLLILCIRVIAECEGNTTTCQDEFKLDIYLSL